MSVIKKIIITILLPALSGCFMNSNLHNADKINMHGKEFTSELARQYRYFSRQEAKNHDWEDSAYFAKKATKSQERIHVDPEHPEDWDVPANLLDELKLARRTLLDVVNGDAIVRLPKVSARAYFLYDCWVEEQEEQWQQESIDSCKREFFEALDYIMTRYTPPQEIKTAIEVDKGKQNKPALQVNAVLSDKLDDVNVINTSTKNKPHKTAPTQPVDDLDNKDGDVVYFASGNVKLNQKYHKIIAEIAKKAQRYEDYLIILNGHTDISGSPQKNLKISSLRNKTVHDILVANGIPTTNIEMFGFGETDPVVFNNKNSYKNRRVEIFIQ